MFLSNFYILTAQMDEQVLIGQYCISFQQHLKSKYSDVVAFGEKSETSYICAVKYMS